MTANVFSARSSKAIGIVRGLKPGFVASVYREIEQRGPTAAGDLDRANHKGSSWWGWTDTKIALEYLFWAGRVTAGFIRPRGRFKRFASTSTMS